ncbi:MAG: aliphatic sulfonate ABC transporter substrate-binding protein [Methanophagales archaeon]|nr:aliphatic sulfonate ABC transporter substrate-binding protein [Methanophagales archaeon]
MKKVKPVKVLIALAALVAMCALTAMPAQICEAREITELRIGYQPSTHQIAHMTAMEKGWWESDLKRFGIDEVTDTEFPSGPPEMTAMMGGALDIAYVGTAPPISAIDKGLDAKIVAAVQTNGSAIVLLPEIAANYTSPANLKGLKIATFPPGSIQDTILRKWLEDNGIDPANDLEIVPMGPRDAISAIAARAVHAVFLPSPSPTIIELEGAGKIVVLSGDMWPDHACCCLLASGELIREHPDLLEQIIRTHINATEYNREHIDEAAEIFAKKVGWDVEKVKASFNRTDMKWIHNPHLEIPSTLEYAKVDYEMGYTDKLLTQDDLFDTSFYDRVTKGIAPPTPTPEATPTITPIPSPTPVITPTPVPTPGFTAVFAIAVLLAVTYLILRRRF